MKNKLYDLDKLEPNCKGSRSHNVTNYKCLRNRRSYPDKSAIFLVGMLFLFCILLLMNQPRPTVVELPLQCYACNSEKTGEDCKNRTAIIANRKYVSSCSSAQKFCQVDSHSMPKDNKSIPMIWSMERSCAEECTPHCTTAPPPLPVQSCTYCCREDLCNGHDRPDLVVLASNNSATNETKSSGERKFPEPSAVVLFMSVLQCYLMIVFSSSCR